MQIVVGTPGYDDVVRWLVLMVVLGGCGDDAAPPLLGVDASIPEDDLAVTCFSSGCFTKCGAVGPNQVCLKGTVFDVHARRPLAGACVGVPMRVGLYEPLTFVANPTAPPFAEIAYTTEGCYGIVVPAPANGTIAVVVQSPLTGGTLVPTVRFMPVMKGQTYTLDTYALDGATADAWEAALAGDGGEDGRTLVELFADPAPPATSWSFSDTHPAVGVRVTLDGQPLAARYLDDNGFVGAATATTTRGAAILSGSGVVSGVGTWQQIGTPAVPGVWSVARLHDCALSTGDPLCP